MQNIKEAFGNNLRKIRKSKKLTVDIFSELLDITPRQLSKIESGETFLTAETLCKICVALDVSLQILFDFEWHDKLMYYDNGKYIKPHFKINVSENEKTAKIKSLPALQDFKINKILPEDQFSQFLTDFAQTRNKSIYVDFFIDKRRESVYKVTPAGKLHYLTDLGNIQNIVTEPKDENYYYAMEKLNEFSIDKNKIEYIKTAIEALSSKKALEKLKAMINGLEIAT